MQRVTRTKIKDITATGSLLSNDELRLAIGGTAPGGPTSKTTYPASITNPGVTDTATDTGHD